jgi:hypothetical protein
MFNFTDSENAQIDQMVAWISEDATRRQLFINTTNNRAAKMHEMRAVGMDVTAIQHELAARQIVEVRTK